MGVGEGRFPGTDLHVMNWQHMREEGFEDSRPWMGRVCTFLRSQNSARSYDTKP